MNGEVDARLRRLLGGPELAEVRQRLRHRFAHAEDEVRVLRLDRLDPAAYRALCQLTGKPSRLAHSMHLDIAGLDARLRAAGLAESLRDALERLDGPIVSPGCQRRALQAAWAEMIAEFEAGALGDWLAHAPRAQGLLKRLGRTPAAARRLLVAVQAVLARLPTAGQPRSQLAARVLGDAHALDPGRPVATLVLAVWRWRERIDREEGTGEVAAEDVPEGREERQRDVWARAGVMVSELARPALCLNLPQPAVGDAVAIPGEPGYLSLRRLLRRSPAWPVAGRRIFVCENPDIVAIAADRLGPDCPPLVCTEGMPAAAQRILLDQLAGAGARLCYHGDYDWPGIAIGNFVLRTWQATPWRFGADDYLAAVALAPARPHDLGTDRVEALWDSRLAAEMAVHGWIVAEEAVAEALLTDLRRAAAG